MDLVEEVECKLYTWEMCPYTSSAKGGPAGGRRVQAIIHGMECTLLYNRLGKFKHRYQKTQIE